MAQEHPKETGSPLETFEARKEDWVEDMLFFHGYLGFVDCFERIIYAGDWLIRYADDVDGKRVTIITKGLNVTDFNREEKKAALLDVPARTPAGDDFGSNESLKPPEFERSFSLISGKSFSTNTARLEPSDKTARIIEPENERKSTRKSKTELLPTAVKKSSTELRSKKSKEKDEDHVEEFDRREKEIDNLSVVLKSYAVRKCVQGVTIGGPAFPTLADLLAFYIFSGEPEARRIGLKRSIPRRIGQWRHQNIKLTKAIHSGPECEVFHATVNSPYFRLTKVAVKKAKEGTPEYKHHVEFLKDEARILKKLSHDHILPFYGWAIDKNPFLFLTKLMDCTLDDFVQRHFVSLTTRRLLTFVVGIAQAVQYLHEKSFLHREVIAKNCFLDESGKCYLGGFRLAVEEKAYKRWECFVLSPPRMCTLLGIYFFEVFSGGHVPYPGKTSAEAGNLILSGKTNDLTDRTPRILRNFIKEHIWAYSTADRPSMNKVVKVLQKQLEVENTKKIKINNDSDLSEMDEPQDVVNKYIFKPELHKKSRTEDYITELKPIRSDRI
ncbi:unnamed protein product [Caenorhabditis auriculariae]|uniref:Protein kinase domain-containing protein n=1 Tax=Caenorhabditis auriculariae TaxID=2777116 RepID=A0A8S1HPD3_9PELO|nr:unnamed protein product [Caenorhabditis auriculariae]